MNQPDRSPSEPPLPTTSAAPTPAEVVGQERARRGRIARSALHLVSGQLATTILSIILNAQLGRTLGAADFGLYFFLLTSTYLANSFIEWGQGIILVRDVARDPSRTSRLLGSSLLIRVGISLPAAALAALIVRAIGYDHRTQLLMALMIVAWIPTALLQTYGLIFRGHERMDLDARATVINKVLHVGFVVGAFSLGGRLVSVILSLAASGATALGWAVHRARAIGFRRPSIDAETTRHLLRDGAPVLILGVLGQAQVYIETILLSSLAPSEVLGWYGAVRSITNTLIMPAAILLTASLPNLSRAAGDPLAMRSELASALRPVIILGVFVATGTVLFADVAINLIYGSEAYGPATTILQLVSGSLFLVFINILLGSVVVLLKKTTEMAIVRVVVIAISSAIAWFAIPVSQDHYGNGAIGALVGTTVGEFLLLIGFAVLVPRGNLPFRMIVVFLRSLVCACISAYLVVVLPLPSPLLSIPLFITSFGIVAAVTRLLRRDDVLHLAAALKTKSRG